MPPPTKQPTAKIERRSPDQLVAHPDADRVPVMPESDYAAFRADVDARGIQVPIEITATNVVLDGRQRLRAARELAHTTVPVVVVSVADELDHMLRASIFRRQVTESQRAALVLELDGYIQARANGRRRQRANLVQAAEVATLPPRGKTRELAARWAGVSERVVQDTQTVQEHDPALFERVKRGEVSANVAARQVRRNRRDQALPPAPPLPEGPFALILADPPWQLGHPNSPHAPENHYPTLPLDEIKALQVPVAEDAMLFLWAVSSLLPEALEVMAAWGFTNKTTLVWIKDWIGPGVWLRNRHELLLVGRRGNHSPPDPEDRADSVLEAARGRHSEKPEQLYQLLERMYPAAAKLELFARRTRPGWTAWGNEVTP
jgi:N6-adenosine-specific RNA methylase IME4/ParB-like chromosome segregation protein Spo0J